jgi:hypothetical protein
MSAWPDVLSKTRRHSAQETGNTAMTVRFQAGVNLNQIILLAVRRREPALDFQTDVAASLTGLNDPEVLAIAARDGRVLVTLRLSGG